MSASAHVVAGVVTPGRPGTSVIVTLEPKGGSATLPEPTERPVMDQFSQTFVPAVLFVRAGRPVEFRNSDETLHNVRVRKDTGEGAFNVAIPTDGTYVYTFEKDGFYLVGCDIHPAMSAEIVATSTPYAALADSNGAFLFDDVAPGTYTLTVYAGERRIEREVEVAGPRTEVRVLE